jgi:serine/threonine-protein kinase
MSSTESHDRLDSWKAIAGYLRRTERTARRWERHEGLPVHRLSHQDRSSVYAFKSELDAWRSTRSVEARPVDVDEAIPGSRRRAWLIAVAVFIAVVAGIGGYAHWQAPGTTAAATPTLAVLPFTVNSADEETGHLGAAVAESLVNHVAGAPDVRVRPFASSMRNYRETEEPAATGKRMGVDVVVAGQVQARGDGLTIKVVLVDVHENLQIWGTSFATTYGELGLLQERIARTLHGETLRHGLGAGHPVPAFDTHRRLSTNPEAVRHFLRGSAFARINSPSHMGRAISELRSAVELDPDFAAAHALMATNYVNFSTRADVPTVETMGLAKAHALRAIALDPLSIDGRRTLAAVSHWYDFDHELADRQFRAAIAAAPGNADVRSWYSEFLIDMGRTNEALAAAQAAAERDPEWLTPDLIRGNALLYGGRPEEAILIYRESLEVEPGFGMAQYQLAQAFLAMDRYAEAISELERSRKDMGDTPFSLASLAYALGRAGRRAEAETMLRDFERRRTAGYYPAYAFAAAYTGLGNHEQALHWLERAADERLLGQYMPNVEVIWEPLRDQARFQRLLQRLDLPDRHVDGAARITRR